MEYLNMIFVLENEHCMPVVSEVEMLDKLDKLFKIEGMELSDDAIHPLNK